MKEQDQKPSLALTLACWALLVLNSLAATFGVLVVVLTRWELSKSGEKWGLMVLPMYCLGGLLVMLPLFIGTVAFVAFAREKVKVVFRWALLFLILVGIVCDISPFVPEFRAVTVPLVAMFE